MNINQIKRRVDIAIQMLRVNDNYLLKHDANERSISHKLAMYLESTFGKNYDVDCEYNRNIEHERGSKNIDILKSEWSRLNGRNINVLDEDMIVEKSVLPDIIVHKRGSNKENLLVIEIKKSTSTVREDYDLKKLEIFTNQNDPEGLKYQYGLFVKFHMNKERFKHPEIILFVNGERKLY